MKIPGEMVKNVFSRNKPRTTQESTTASVRSYNGMSKRRWNSVRSYLCGNELFNSVLAEEDSASFKSSEVTITQPLHFHQDNGEIQKDEMKNSISKLFLEDDAAIIIQSAFRDFLVASKYIISHIAKYKLYLQARRQSKEMKLEDDKQEEVLTATESPSRNSIATSVEVQAGNSVEALSVSEESVVLHHQKARTQVFRIKEDWDDSTVSSNISKMRIQNRLEAMTRRERALAYAFSQQLRICSKKKHKSDGSAEEPNMGWSWLERWMATRLPESLPVESKQSYNNHNVPNFVVRKSFFDFSIGEEKESCGSNEVSVHHDTLSEKDNEYEQAAGDYKKCKTESISEDKIDE
ncbi:protein IQ-DOMAIN 33-like [Rutidosis leptorrhynchoides]|uniref:protein IQ-DOMAIN 33-like n=1 Tax=Rutidosis leptorrhynchoides TaxID=125765 RepID=UPI003A99FAFA